MRPNQDESETASEKNWDDFVGALGAAVSKDVVIELANHYMLNEMRGDVANSVFYAFIQKSMTALLKERFQGMSMSGHEDEIQGAIGEAYRKIEQHLDGIAFSAVEGPDGGIEDIQVHLCQQESVQSRGAEQ